MTLMIPETMVNDLFQCTAARMNGDIIKLIKGQKTCESRRFKMFDGWTEIRIAEFDRHGNICLSVNYLADYFDYDYQWDDENNTAMLAMRKMNRCHCQSDMICVIMEEFLK